MNDNFNNKNPWEEERMQGTNIHREKTYAIFTSIDNEWNWYPFFFVYVIFKSDQTVTKSWKKNLIKKKTNVQPKRIGLKIVP